MVSLKHVKCKGSLAKDNTNQLNFPGMPFRETLSDVNIPLYKSHKPTIAHNFCRELQFSLGEEQTLLDSLLLAQWEDFAFRGLIRYDVTSFATKVVSGDRNFVAKLNEHWNFNILETGNIVHQEPGYFICNILNVLRDDILFCVTTGDKESSELIRSSSIPKDSIIVIPNKTPIEYGHVFLVPYNFHDPISFLGSLESIICIAMEVNNSSFRVFFDLPASSNSNYLYFEACYFPNDFSVENMSMIPVCHGLKNEGVGIYEIANYPIKSLMFSTKHNFRMLTEVVTEICSWLTDQNARYNFLISDNGRKVFLFIQVQNQSNDCILSAWECGGHFVYDAYDDFDKAGQDVILQRMAAVSLDEESFRAVKRVCCEVVDKLFPRVMFSG